MTAIYKSKIFYGILLFTIIGEFAVPWILKHFYEGYSSTKMMMSVLGSPESPMRVFYNIWLVWLGIFLLFTAFVLFQREKSTSFILAILQSFCIAFFAVGAGIISGLYSTNESSDVVTTASMIHETGVVIGFMLLIFFPLFHGIMALKLHDKKQALICFTAFALAFVTFAFLAMGDKEFAKGTFLEYEGLWERITLFCMYVPFIYIACEKLFCSNK